MKLGIFVGYIFILCLIFWHHGYADDMTGQISGKAVDFADKSAERPMALIKEPRFQFEPILEGTVISHNFIIENSGNAPLIIEKVKTSCGCTTADFTREIAAGAEGKISIKGNTRGYAGRVFSKTITVFTNDPTKRRIMMSISGPVEAFAAVEPDMIRLRGVTGDAILVSLRVTPAKKYPFTIVEIVLNGVEKKVSCTLTKEKETYLITVENLMTTPGTYRGGILLKTDNALKPEINIPVYGVITQQKDDGVIFNGGKKIDPNHIP